MRLAAQLSFNSEPESERILAVGGIKQANRHVPRIKDPPDLDPEEQEGRIRHQIETIRERLRVLLERCASGTSIALSITLTCQVFLKLLNTF